MYRIWLNADETGFIVDSVGGHEEYIVEPKEEVFTHYFYVDDYTFKNINLFKVFGGDLVLI